MPPSYLITTGSIATATAAGRACIGATIISVAPSTPINTMVEATWCGRYCDRQLLARQVFPVTDLNGLDRCLQG